jgi:hypothetical protein
MLLSMVADLRASVPPEKAELAENRLLSLLER